MGIKQLSKVLADHAPRSISDHTIADYFGRRIAVDASTSLYQFLIAVRSDAQSGFNNLTNAEGKTTSHLMGMFYRTVRMMEAGLKPVFVFDGRAPEAKRKELTKRGERRLEAEAGREDAEERGDVNAVEKFVKRSVRVTQEHVDDCKELLKLMGVPFLQAPGEAEAQCAALAKKGTVFAVGSEDMDTLTFGAPVLLRHLTFSEARKLPIVEVRLQDALCGLNMAQESFTDLCILLGCDYCSGVKGVGPAKAVQLIKEHKSIDQAVQEKAISPDADWPYQEAQRLFRDPDVRDLTPDEEASLKWAGPSDPEALVDFMVGRHGFNDKRIRTAVERLVKLAAKGTQTRMDDFFKAVSSSGSLAAKKAADGKKKGDKEKRPAGGLVTAGKKLKKF